MTGILRQPGRGGECDLRLLQETPPLAESRAPPQSCISPPEGKSRRAEKAAGSEESSLHTLWRSLELYSTLAWFSELLASRRHQRDGHSSLTEQGVAPCGRRSEPGAAEDPEDPEDPATRGGD
ncbi:unnamed protein product [Pleuronectes platessa]|uniref:Uncharacterized protein n=1 Tax=Pleuronectes platessa TaxID=8262 RepID=A0A9N7ZA71_PLEPL|nr:unnamed protein product [Pleuronectes platessa]